MKKIANIIALVALVTSIACLLSCTKDESLEKKSTASVKAYVLQLSFELEDRADGDVIIVRNVDTKEETIYHDVVIGLNKVEFTVPTAKGQLQLLFRDKDGTNGSLDYLFYDVSLK